MKPSLLEVRHLAKSFGRHRVLIDATVVVRRGELVGVTGENGSGKSTLLKIVAGLLRPDGGRVLRMGTLGYCPQEPLVFDRLTVAENFRYFGTAYGLGDWPAAMARWTGELGFAKYTTRLVAELSGGTRQKLNLALALLHDPQVLILDEPYAGFDWETYLRFWQLADRWRAAGHGVLIISHFVYERERFTRLGELRDGMLACD